MNKLEERWIEEKKEWLLKHEARKGLCDEQQTWPPLAWLACVGSEVHMTVLATHQCIRRLPNDSSSLKDRMNNPLYMQHVPAGWQVNSEQHSVHVQPSYTVYNVQYNTYRNCWSREIKLSLFLGIRVQCTQNTLFRNTNVYICARTNLIGFLLSCCLAFLMCCMRVLRVSYCGSSEDLD